MAGIVLSQLQLLDKWPGLPNPNLGIPTGGWANSTDNYKTTATTDVPTYPLGTKIMAYTDNSYCPGYYTMQYLMYHSLEDADKIDVADYSKGSAWCAHMTDSCSAERYLDDISGCPNFIVTNEITAADCDATEAQRLCFPCFTLESDGTTAEDNSYGDAYGWFWVGGVCPCKEATLLDDGTGVFKGLGKQHGGCRTDIKYHPLVRHFLDGYPFGLGPGKGTDKAIDDDSIRLGRNRL